MTDDPVAEDAGLMEKRERRINIAQDLLIEFDVDMLLDNDKSDQLRDNIVAALQAAEERGAERMQWQPIETAPKGKRILLKVRPREHLGSMTEVVAVGEWHESPNKDRWRWDGWQTDLGPFKSPSGWLPLPTIRAIPTDKET